MREEAYSSSKLSLCEVEVAASQAPGAGRDFLWLCSHGSGSSAARAARMLPPRAGA